MRTLRRTPSPVLVLAAVVWLALPLAVPVALARGWEIGAVLYAGYHSVCHQLAERSFWVQGSPVAVCHRCLGLYAGVLAGLLTLPFLHALRMLLLERPVRILWFALPMLLDVASPFDLWASRFGTGLVASYPVALVLWTAWEQIFAAGRQRLSSYRGEQNERIA